MKTDYAIVPTELKTINDFLRWSASEFERAEIFYGHGTDNAWDEAVQLVLPALKLPLDLLDNISNARLLTTEKIMLTELVRKRTQEHVPVPYLTHQAWFAGLPFYIDERVLIPRSPLAEIIEQHFSPWLSDEQEISDILEIGTGSGCIACACAVAFPDAEVDAVDISPAALEVAQKNVSALCLDDQVHLIESDIYSALKNKKYDIIISNPPYVDAAEMAALPKEYLHEPQLGLASGADGLDHVRGILKDAKKHLKPNGLLVVEVGASADALMSAFSDIPFTWLDLERGGMGVFMLNESDF